MTADDIEKTADQWLMEADEMYELSCVLGYESVDMCGPNPSTPIDDIRDSVLEVAAVRAQAANAAALQAIYARSRARDMTPDA